MRGSVSRGVAIAVMLTAAGVSRAQSFVDVPRLFTRSPEVFGRLFTEARCRTVNALILGDSQETSPYGGGSVYVPRLDYEFWTRIGNAPATPWIQMGWNTGGGLPPADWLNRTGNPAQAVTQTRLEPSFVPPGMSAVKTSTTNGNNVNGNQIYGNMIMLQHDAASVSPESGLAGLSVYFDPAGEIYMDVMSATHESSGEVRLRVTSAPSPATNYFQPTAAWFTSSMGLERSDRAVIVQRLGPIPNALSGRYLQVEVSGTDSSKFTDVIGVRFVNVADRSGWCISSLSAGGYKAMDLIQRHGECGPVLGAMNPDVVMLCYGANDGNGYTREMQPITAAVFRSDLEAAIAFVRLHTRPDLPVILMSDPYRSGFHNENAAQNYDQFPSAAYEIALADPLVCALNGRRLTHEAGWTPQNAEAYLTDGVHYSPAGATLKARVEADALFGAFLAPASDCNANGVDDSCDIAAGTSGDSDGDGVPDECGCETDVNHDGASDQADVGCLIMLVAGDASCSPGDPDFNADGVPDQLDVADLVMTIAGAPCP